MQVEVDVACMYTNLCGHGLSGFGDITTFKIGQISLSDHGLQSMVVKNLNQIELAQKIHASRGSCSVHVHQFLWAWPLRFQRYYYFQNWLNFPFGPWTTVYGSQKFESNRIGSKNSCK